jgi:Cobalamin biosynthesis central region.
VHGLTAVDVLSREYNLAMEPFEAVRKINSALVNGEPVHFYSEYNLPAELTGFTVSDPTRPAQRPPGSWAVFLTGRVVPEPDRKTLFLRPRNLTVGVGCRRGQRPPSCWMP